MCETDELPDGEIDFDNPPFPLTEKDRLQLATRDEDFSRITWEEVQDIIGKTDSTFSSTLYHCKLFRSIKSLCQWHSHSSSGSPGHFG